MGNDQIGANGIYYAELLAAKVIEGVRDFPSVGASERRAMLELVAAKLTTEAAETPEANHASG
jgi:hypothetical protein